MPTRTSIFTTIRTEGLLLPPDLLQRIIDNDPTLDGLAEATYHRPGEKRNEVINQSWNTLQGIWANFKAARDNLPAGDLGTTLTRERWLLPLFRELDYGRLATSAATDFTIDGKNYPISHKSIDGIPIHLVSYQIDLDRRTPGVAGASTASPHSLVQVLLNRSEAQLWGFLSNGYKLRILRDNASMTRQAYVEFDLQAMMDGEVYSDFVLVWLLCHQSRVENGRECWLEKWAQTTQVQGTRALDQLRDGVQTAIEALGVGFLDYPENGALRDKLQNGDLSAQDYYRQLLRLVYRLLVMFTAEDRELLYDPATSEEARQRYTDHYSTRRFRRIAERLKGTRHADLYESFRLVTRLLGGEIQGAASLGLPVLDSFLFRDKSLADLINAKIANVHFLDAIRALAFVEDTATRSLRPNDYRNLGPEELGSVYESLLELHPQMNIPARTFALATAGGNERKTTGSYCTPTSLINALLDSALDPVIAEARRKPNPEAALLDLKVCDPACGSGHFLIAAAHRIAHELARVQSGEEAPSPNAHRAALRDVIGHCIYGVDINEMAVELCKVNLWLEALEPGKPLNFLDHRIQVGNSLLGTTPALMAQGIPDDAFNPIEGDDKADSAWLKKLNRQERKDRETGQRSLFEVIELPADYRAITAALNQLDDIADDTLDGLRRKEQAYADLDQNPEKQKAQILADAWCAAFVWDKGVSNNLPPMTDLQYKLLQKNPLDPRFENVRKYVQSLKKRYQFFHWHVAFSDVFTVDTRPLIADDGAGQTGWIGGFDCVLGNPPWEHTEIKEQEWFAERNSEIAIAAGSNRKRMIMQLKELDPNLYLSFQDVLRVSEGLNHLVRSSGRFPLTARGRINTYPLFAETAYSIINGLGFIGMIVPSGIASDENTRFFFRELMESRTLVSLYSFENEEFLFATVHNAFKFCLLTISGIDLPNVDAEFVFFARQPDQIYDVRRRFTLSAEDIDLINPNTHTTATFRSGRDAELTKMIYREIGILICDDPASNIWGINFKQGLFNMTSDSHLFRTIDQMKADDLHLYGNQFRSETTTFLPLYEAKMMHQYDHRYATYQNASQAEINSGRLPKVSDLQKQDLNGSVLPRYWVPDDEVRKNLDSWQQEWLITFRGIARSTDQRTLIAAVLPLYACSGKNFLLLPSTATTNEMLSLLANLNSFVTDYVVRQKVVGTDMSFFYFKQFPILSPHTFSLELQKFIVPRVLELTYTAWDLQSFARDVGYNGTPFIWDNERRFLIRCELDALYFHLYQINRADADYIMDTFPIIKRNDEAIHGTYRTKDIILTMYDEMALLAKMFIPTPKDKTVKYAVPDVTDWVTRLYPLPGDERAAHST